MTSFSRLAVLAALLTLALVAAPLVAHGQTAGKVYRIGVLDTSPMARNAVNMAAFRQGLRELGYVEGQHFVIEYRSPRSGATEFPDLAHDLVRSKVDVILTRGTAAVMAAKNATRTIPIVMTASGDPIGMGVVPTLARPGGNVTGLTTLSAEVSAKRMQLLKEAIPGIQRVATLIDMASGLVTLWRTTEQSARAMGLQPQLLDVRKAEDLAPAFEAAVKQRADAMVASQGTVLQNNIGRVVELAARHRLPAIYPSREFTDAGGLMAYGAAIPDLYRRAGAYVDKIFKGAQAGDLPIEQPTKFEFLVNLKTAGRSGSPFHRPCCCGRTR
jgi:ABC-type uncharacterized transport system substrate-binding protein